MKVCTLNICGAINSTKRFYASRGPISKKNEEKNLKAKEILKRVRDFIKDEEIDIIGLQEIDLSGFNQPRFLAEIADMQEIYGSNFKYDLFDFVKVNTGNAILSRNPLLKRKEVKFPRRKTQTLIERLKGEKKLLAGSTTEGIQIISAHLTHNDYFQRELELEFLLKYCINHTPSILLGDLNFMPNPQRHKEYSEKELYSKDKCTDILEEFRTKYEIQIELDLLGNNSNFYTTGNPRDKTVDYIMLFCKKGDKTKLKLVKTYVAEIKVSDHEPIIAEIELN